jgi:hypothetical protein
MRGEGWRGWGGGWVRMGNEERAVLDLTYYPTHYGVLQIAIRLF